MHIIQDFHINVKQQGHPRAEVKDCINLGDPKRLNAALNYLASIPFKVGITLHASGHDP